MRAYAWKLSYERQWFYAYYIYYKFIIAQVNRMNYVNMIIMKSLAPQIKTGI